MELDFYLKLTISIVCIGTPILIQAISYLDTKYNSQLIIAEFKNERITKYFAALIFISLCSIIMRTSHLSNYFIRWRNRIEYKEIITVVLIISTILLVFTFLKLVYQTSIYYNSHDLHNHLTKKFNKPYVSNENKLRLRQILHDLFFYSIDKNNSTLYKTAYTFIISDFSKEQKKLNYLNDKLPFDLYNFQRRITKVGLQKSKEFTIIETDLLRLSSTQSLIRGSKYSKLDIADLTYNNIWANLNYMILEKNSMFLNSYYSSAYQHFQFQRNFIYGNRENKMFQEDKYYYFNIVVGAKIYNHKIQDTLRHIFTHTQSLPYKNNLLPNSMDEVLNIFYTTNNSFYSYLNDSFFRSFHEGIGFQHEEKIIDYVNSFTALLFLRQWTIVSRFYYQGSSLEIYPHNFTIRRNEFLINSLPRLKMKIEVELANHNQLNELGWLNTIQNRIHAEISPLTAIESYMTQLRDNHNIQKSRTEISPSKKTMFLEISKNTIVSYLSELKKLTNSDEVFGNSILICSGYKHIGDKEPLTNESNSDYLNYFEIHSQGLIRQLNSRVASNFSWKAKSRYKIVIEDLEPTIHRLNINNFYIIIFGNITWKSINQYKDKIINFPLYTDAVGDSLFFIKKEDFPQIEFLSIPDEHEHFDFSLLDADTHLKMSVEDLYVNTNLATIVNSTATPDIARMVHIYIKLNIKLQWKKNINMTQIEIVPPFQNEGQLNTPQQIYL